MTVDADLRTAARVAVPRVVGRLMNRHHDFAACEDAVQEALIAALEQWPVHGLPHDPTAWLTTVAHRRLVDSIRKGSARRHREAQAALSQAALGGHISDRDDSLDLLFLCCHPDLTRAAQAALTLRVVAGLTTAEIARAHFVSEATMAQRISRAKRTISRSSLGVVDAADIDARMPVVLKVLYVLFTEGHTATSGTSVSRVDLSAEAIRVTRLVRAALPNRGEVDGLLALMLLTDARRPARVRVDGVPIPIDEQDRSLWDRDLIDEGVTLVEAALTSDDHGPYQLQAAIAAVHAQAITAAATDWREIEALYRILEHIDPGPMTALGHLVAFGRVHGARAALAELEQRTASDAALVSDYRSTVLRAHLLAEVGERDHAAAAYRSAAEQTLSVPERRFLLDRAQTRAPTSSQWP